MSKIMHCSLCGCSELSLFHRDKKREYWRCTECQLVLVPAKYWLSNCDEKKEYDLHENKVDDPGYRKFLSRLSGPLLERIPAGARGLEFGCGPGPALAAMLCEAGADVSLYDIYYHPDATVFEKSYQFITATEVVEHLQAPGRELDRLWQLLELGGYLGIMTKLVQDREAFQRWHYISDPTHISFFSDQTWLWWAQQNNAQLTRIGADVILLQRC